MKKIFTVLGISAAFLSNAQIIINEVYGGGGNSGATYKNDFVELINAGTSTATLTGATLQYASAANAFNVYHPLPEITLQPGQTYLIQEAKGNGGTVDLEADYIAPAPTSFGTGTNTVPGFAMSGTSGKIVLASDATQVAGPTSSNVLDFVGFGTASQFEGTGPAPAPSNTTSVSRTGGVDTNNNAADFTAGAPTPKNSVLAVSNVSVFDQAVKMNTVVTNELIISVPGKATVNIFSADGRLVSSSRVDTKNTISTSSLAKGNYIVTVDNGTSKASRKIIKN